MDNDKLIYGKNPLERIVSVEARGDKLEIFTEDTNGEIASQILPHYYWILSSESQGRGWNRLKGDLHYKYGKQFTTLSDYLREKNFLRHADTFCIFDAKEAAMVKDGMTYYKGMRHDEPSILAFDIETTGLEHNDQSKVLLIANTFRKCGKIIRKLFSYSDYKDEGEMIEAWCDWFREMNPSIVIGHNIFVYDLPYLRFVANKFGKTLKLGRDDSDLKFSTYESRFRKDATQFYHYFKVSAYGREFVDTMFLAVKYDIGRKYESYALKAIIKAEGKEVEGRVFYDADKIRHNYLIPEEWAKIQQYAIHDGDDALTLYDLMSPPFFYMTQSVPKPYQLMLESASGAQINSVMMRAYLQEAHSLPKATESQDYKGATSFGNPGIFRNVFKIDIASLYPNIMLQYEVYDKDKDPQAYFLRLVQTFTERRLKHKKLAKDTKDKYYDDLQNAEKIFINSAYGFLGASGLLFNSPAGAAFVTEKGREILQTTIDWATNNGYQIVNADTDSISFCKKDGGAITGDDQKMLLNEVNALFPEKIKFENDGYFLTVIVLAAKNYVLWDGVKLKYKGSAIVASTKEKALKEFIKDIFKVIIDNTQNYTEVYNRYVSEILEVEDITRWVTRKTITDKILNPKRTNERKVLEAISASKYFEGDRAYFYFKKDNSLGLAEFFDGDYNEDRLLEKLYKTSRIFDTILDVDELFLNYKLKKNKSKLELLALEN